MNESSVYKWVRTLFFRIKMCQTSTGQIVKTPEKYQEIHSTCGRQNSRNKNIKNKRDSNAKCPNDENDK